MPEMNDYSGPFKPDLTLDDFSKDFLIKLIHEYEYAWLHMTEAWYYALQERCGDQTANYCELEAWLRVGEKVNPRYAQLANIQLNTVLDSLKAMQMPLDNIRADALYSGQLDIKSPNHVIMTIPKCRSLEFFEKHAPERMDWVCFACERAIGRKYAINPKINVRFLRTPPRKGPDDICCQWEWWIDE